MLNSTTHDKLSALRLHEMAHAWQEQQRIADHDALTFDERFGMLVDAQWLGRENRRLQRSLKEARLRLIQAYSVLPGESYWAAYVMRDGDLESSRSQILRSKRCL